MNDSDQEFLALISVIHLLNIGTLWIKAVASGRGPKFSGKYGEASHSLTQLHLLGLVALKASWMLQARVHI